MGIPQSLFPECSCIQGTRPQGMLVDFEESYKFLCSILAATQPTAEVRLGLSQENPIQMWRSQWR